MKHVKFIRYGSLNPVYQEGFIGQFDDQSKRTFHTPPARYGIYCFPEGGIELFLLGKNVFDPARMVKAKKETNKTFSVWKNKKVFDIFESEYISDDSKKSDDEINTYRDKNSVIAEHIKPKKFSHCGDVWHHLKTENSIRVIGSWYLTNYTTWLKLYRQEKILVRNRNYSRDHLEVFIEEII